MSESSTLASVLESQASLLQEASLALPHQFSQCTYPNGPIRQAVYLCLTCTSPASSTTQPRGICSACSIACHTDHEQLELFPKRRFRCDCPTHGLTEACTLHAKEEPVNQANEYGPNFRAVFCRCGRKYDANKERETMIQCLQCEDWFHESCLNLRERPPSREPTPEAQEPPASDGASDASSSGLPPPLVTAEDYDALICSACVRKVHAVERIAGMPGAIMVVRSSDGEPWRAIGQQEVIVVDEKDTSTANGHPGVTATTTPTESTGEKRGRSASVDQEPTAKRARVSPTPEGADYIDAGCSCSAPPRDRRVQNLFKKLHTPNEGVSQEEISESYQGLGDVFLIDGWRDRWCSCGACAESLKDRSYLVEEEDTYEPPEDPDSGLSLEELGMRALQRLPREQALNGIMAFNAMRDDLMQHLRPFAERGEEVPESAIRAFFNARIQELEAKRR
ncbi:uncharacterized protein BXZ73DRAFT_52376 [Epithele typhae]|uniref:uncharacterized protein n=1 Tax=Epithele typhae TaxID=378194 RepID=UPI002008464A|nr:uncharacterized protein BXZ73DRAFT_52376 [Epithele typhae]KAH9919997.1 hypothetical protein BXZ73DRAFT_52376 [Epithele typhae]